VQVLTEHGVRIAPSTYYAHRSAGLGQALRDALLLIEIVRIHSDPNIGRACMGCVKNLGQVLGC